MCFSCFLLLRGFSNLVILYLTLTTCVIPHFVLLSIWRWTYGLLGSFYLLTFVNMGVQISWWDLSVSSFVYIPRNWIVSWYGNFSFTFLRNCRTIFHGGWTILYFYQQCTRVAISPHPYQYIFSAFIFILRVAILVVWGGVSLFIWLLQISVAERGSLLPNVRSFTVTQGFSSCGTQAQ